MDIQMDPTFINDFFQGIAGGWIGFGPLLAVLFSMMFWFSGALFVLGLLRKYAFR
jgi:hypothetical protein